MKFKKFLGAVCSFLLATTSFLCGGFASARYHDGKLSVIVMINSGEELQDGTYDGEPEDKVYYNSFQRTLLENRGFSTNMSPNTCYFFSHLNKCCPSIEQSMLWMTMCNVPDFFVITANLAKTEDQIKSDLNKHFEQISHCQKNAVLFMGKNFQENADVPLKEIYLNTVPVVICGTLSRNTPQITSHDKFTEIARSIRAERQGEGENKFKYIYDEVCVTEDLKPHVFINMGNMARTEKDFDEFCHETIVKDDIKPAIWESYRNTEFPSRVAKTEEEVSKCISSETVRLKNLARIKNFEVMSLRNQSDCLCNELTHLSTVAASQRKKEARNARLELYNKKEELTRELETLQRERVELQLKKEKLQREKEEFQALQRKKEELQRKKEERKTGKRQRKEVDSKKSEAPKPKKSKK